MYGIQSMKDLVGERATSRVALVQENENRSRASLVVRRERRSAMCRTNVSRASKKEGSSAEEERKEKQMKRQEQRYNLSWEGSGRGG